MPVSCTVNTDVLFKRNTLLYLFLKKQSLQMLAIVDMQVQRAVLEIPDSTGHTSQQADTFPFAYVIYCIFHLNVEMRT